MKKRKLKKKIKKLKSDIKWLKGCQHNLALRENNNANHIKSCKEAITKLESNPKLQMYRQCTWCKHYDSVVNNDTIYYKCDCSNECINSDKFEMREGMD